MFEKIKCLIVLFFLFAACSGGGEQAVVLSEVGYYTDKDLEKGEKAGTLFRGTRIKVLGEKKNIHHGRIVRQVVRCRILQRKEPVWLPVAEKLPGRIVEQRLWIGYSTNAYLVQDSRPSLLPGKPAQTALTAPAGTGLLILGRAGGWLKVHYRDRIVWFPNRGITFDRFFPEITVQNVYAGTIRVQTSPWYIPILGEERLHGPDSLFSKKKSRAWISAKTGWGDSIKLHFSRSSRFRLSIVNGYSFSSHTYNLYNRLKRCRIRCGGVSREFLLRDHTTNAQDLSFWAGRRLTLEVTGLYSGSGRDHLALQRLELIPVGLP